MAEIKLTDLTKSYGPTEVLHHAAPPTISCWPSAWERFAK